MQCNAENYKYWTLMPPFARFGGNKNNKTLDILLQETRVYLTFAHIHIMLASTYFLSNFQGHSQTISAEAVRWW